MIYGYARLGASEINKNITINKQINILLENKAEEIFVDDFNRSLVDRPELTRLSKLVKKGDVIVADKIIRIADTISDFYLFVDNMINNGVTIQITDFGVLDDSKEGKLARVFLSKIVEYEYETRSERVTSGQGIKRQQDNNWKEGRPEKELDEKLLEECFIAYKRQEKSLQDCAKELNIATSSFSNRLKKWKKENPNWKEKIKVPEKPKTDIQKVKERYQSMVENNKKDKE